MVHTLLLVGAGHIGSRHLQGLAKAKLNLEIYVVEPSWVASSVARSRWNESKHNGSHTIHWLDSIPSDLNTVDVCIVSTSAKGRADLISRLASKTNVRYWIIEKVLAQGSSEIELICDALGKSAGAWVNTPRRTMRLHKAFRSEVLGTGPLGVLYGGGLWGLACNGIHLIDLIAWWSGKSLLSIDTGNLNRNWYESKRHRYFETTGELVAHFSGGTSLRLISKKGPQEQGIRVTLSDGIVWEIDEIACVARSSLGRKLTNEREFQSQLTGKIVNQILQQGQCDLPSLVESSAMHAIFLDAMVTHWNLSQNRNDDLVPIT